MFYRTRKKIQPHLSVARRRGSNLYGKDEDEDEASGQSIFEPTELHNYTKVLVIAPKDTENTSESLRSS